MSIHAESGLSGQNGGSGGRSLNSPKFGGNRGNANVCTDPQGFVATGDEITIVN